MTVYLERKDYMVKITPTLQKMIFKVNGTQVSWFPLQHAVSKRREFLTKFENPVLCMHNSCQFDSVVPCRAMNIVPGAGLDECFCGCFDSLEFVRKRMRLPYHRKVLHNKLLLKTFYVRNMQPMNIWKTPTICKDWYAMSRRIYGWIFLCCTCNISSVFQVLTQKLDVVTLGNLYQTQRYKFIYLLKSKCSGISEYRSNK
jgi:hypothetical protein